MRIVVEAAPAERPPLDIGQIRRALDNLVLNAIQHSPPDGTVRLSGSREESRLRIRVSDEGPGVCEPVRSRLFDPFVTTRMGRGGTGLGLHIVHNLVFNTLGGSVSVKSQVGEGTEFQLELPLIAPAQAGGRTGEWLSAGSHHF